MSDQRDNAPEATSFEWDEKKRNSNLEKHGIDFVDAIEIFLSAHVDVVSKHPGELRHEATGEVAGRIVTVVHTRRGDVIRLISARIARRNERERYRALHAGGDS